MKETKGPSAEAGRNEKPKTGREQRRDTVCVQAAAHRGTVCTFVRQKYQKRGGFRNAPSTSEGLSLIHISSLPWPSGRFLCRPYVPARPCFVPRGLSAVLGHLSLCLLYTSRCV